MRASVYFFFQFQTGCSEKILIKEKIAGITSKVSHFHHPSILKTNSCTLLLNTPIYCTLVPFAILHFMGI